MTAHNLPISERLLLRAEPDLNSGCWLWNGALWRDGYGRILINKVGMAAHRVSYRTFVGPIPDGLCVLHKCDVPMCINPQHLTIGDHKTNMRDMAAKGRAGSPSEYRRMSKSEKDAIRAATGSLRAIAARFGRAASTIRKARSALSTKED
jgi:hypothetical protein